MNTSVERQSHCSAFRQQHDHLLHPQRGQHKIPSTLAGSSPTSAHVRSVGPGLANVKADALLWGKQVEEWAILREIVVPLFDRLGWPQTDLLADSSNAFIPRFFSIKEGDKGAMGHNAFHQPWNSHLAYALPPPQLIAQTLGKLVEVPSVMILMTLQWQEAMWWGEVVAFSVCPLVLLPMPTLCQQSTSNLRKLQLVEGRRIRDRGVHPPCQIQRRVNQRIIPLHTQVRMEVLAHLVLRG